MVQSTLEAAHCPPRLHPTCHARAPRATRPVPHALHLSHLALPPSPAPLLLPPNPLPLPAWQALRLLAEEVCGHPATTAASEAALLTIAHDLLAHDLCPRPDPTTAAGTAAIRRQLLRPAVPQPSPEAQAEEGEQAEAGAPSGSGGSATSASTSTKCAITGHKHAGSPRCTAPGRLLPWPAACMQPSWRPGLLAFQMGLL